VTDLQELITRGRFIFDGAPKRIEIFTLINGKRSAKEIAKKAKRPFTAVLHDIEKLKNMELVQEKKDANGVVIKKNSSIIYEKVPLIRHVSLSYFEPVSKTAVVSKQLVRHKVGRTQKIVLRVPTENEILEVCKNLEDQVNEFKGPGVEIDKITREISAFLNTKNGGIIFYGVDDDGIIVGTDLTRHQLDDRLQNSIRHTINPQPNIEVKERDVMGTKILLVMVPPWDRKNIYQYTKTNHFNIRKGANVFALKPEEIAKLSRGEYVV
jgi:DNA-binding transcriptional ArsR family regulator